MLEIKNIRKTFDEKVALDNVSFDIPDGTIVGFFGLNGAGKSTLMKIICGLQKPDSGHFLLDGRPIKDERIPHLGYMIEDPAFYAGLTGYENLKCLSYLYDGISSERIDEVLRIVGLEDAKNKLYKTYSLGMKKRLYFALAIMNKPKILILDEPFNGIDPVTVALFEKILLAYRKEGASILVSSHEIREVEAFADRAVIIDKGRILHDDEKGADEDLFGLFLSLVDQGGAAQ